uniref:Scavenger receptor class B member 1 n=1 Tax=Cacopsylla melanoneura TaxID=428564 RepID=A0A8D9BCY6_9HEMI
MSSQKKHSQHHPRRHPYSNDELSLLQPSNHSQFTIVEKPHKNHTPRAVQSRKPSPSESVQPKIPQETNAQMSGSQKNKVQNLSPLQTNITITENESGYPSDQKHRNHFRNPGSLPNLQESSNILPNLSNPNDKNGRDSNSFNCSNNTYLSNIHLASRSHGQALPEHPLPNTNNKSDVTDVTNSILHSKNCGVAETSNKYIVKDDQTDDVTDPSSPLNSNNDQSNTNTDDVTDPCSPLNPNPSEVRLTKSDIYARVPTPVGPIEVRPSRNQLYYRKIHKYLLFRSDQHLLYRSCVFIIGSLISAFLLYILWFTDLYWISIRRINVLEPDGSISYRNFHEIPVKDNTFCVTVFNITNLAEFYASYEKPVLQIEPVGPYCFREILEKINIEFNENLTRVSYSENSKFQYLEHLSNGSLNDVVNVVSFPYMTITSHVSQMNFLAKMTISSQIKAARYKPFVTLRVNSFLFGYDDEFLTWTYNLGTKFGFFVPVKRFSMLDQLLDQINSNFTVDTGKSNIDTLQRVQSYNGRSDMEVWQSPSCNAYDGTDGTFYDAAPIKERRNVSFFSNFICRNVKMMPVEEISFFKFSTVPRYTMVPELFMYNKTGDDCYCVDPPCIDNLFYAGDCFPGPIVFSYKYFHGVDRQHLTHLSPLPDPGDWKTYFDVFPGLGSATASTQRIQINLEVRKAQFFNHLSYFDHKTVLPGVYIERTFPALTFEAYWYLFHSTFTLPALEWFLKYVLVAVNILFLYYLLVVLFVVLKYVILKVKSYLDSFR